MGCCSDAAAPGLIAEAQRQFRRLAPGAASEPGMAGPASQPDRVLLKYTGIARGVVSFIIGDTLYQGADTSLNRMIEAQPAHVEKLLATGQWQIVRAEASPSAGPEGDPAAIPLQELQTTR